MDLAATYREVRKSIVAFVPRYVPLAAGQERPEVPPIVGTGFIVGDGVVITNDHVVRTVARLQRPPDAPKDEPPFAVLLLHEVDEGVAQIYFEVLGLGVLREIQVEGHYYGPRRLDLAAVHIKAKGLPKIAVDSGAVPLEEGRLVATAGFPMGTDALVAPGYLHQLTPTLQQGIISAVLPFSGTPRPHALMINVMTQGGASGSPVFAPDRPAVIGVLYAGLNDVARSPGMPAAYRVPTNQSYVVAAHYLEHVLDKLKNEKAFVLPPDTLSLEEMMATYKRENLKPRGEFGLARQGTETLHVKIVKRSEIGSSEPTADRDS